MMHVGFTGTRHGWRKKQYDGITNVLLQKMPFGPGIELRFLGKNATAHIGDCLGADAEFHNMVRGIAWRTVGHIPSDPTHRAFLDYDETREPLPYMERNAAIVNASTMVIATPYEMTEQPRGGTWATIRLARRAKKPLVIVYPDGSIAGEFG